MERTLRKEGKTGGDPRHQKGVKSLRLIFVLLFFSICLIPSLGLLFSGEEASLENRESAAFPSFFREDGSFNLFFLSEAGDYFQDHFGFRNELVSAFAVLSAKAGHVSSQEGVILGKEGWLFYRDSLEDFQGKGQMDERGLFDFARTMALCQTYAEGMGASFALAVAPNKNSLYGEYMPYYDRVTVTSEKNLTGITPYLQEEGVSYADLFGVLSREKASREETDFLYLKTDSHWNNEGAMIASGVILDTLGREKRDYGDAQTVIRKDNPGDLEKMLYPAFFQLEREVYFVPEPAFSYVSQVHDSFYPLVDTEGTGEGSLIMYRDSFANKLLPFLAENFKEGFFRRGMPYDLTPLSSGVSALVIECAERFLPELLSSPPVYPAPLVLFLPGEAAGEKLYVEGMEVCYGRVLGAESLKDLSSELYDAAGASLIKVAGLVDRGALSDQSRIFVSLDETLWFEASLVQTEEGEEGFTAYVDRAFLPFEAEEGLSFTVAAGG